MVLGSERLGLLSDYTANCLGALSSERAPNRYKTANFRHQHSDLEIRIALVVGLNCVHLKTKNPVLKTLFVLNKNRMMDNDQNNNIILNYT
jgi:hypothetical protein